MFRFIAQAIAGVLTIVLLAAASCITVVDTPSPGGGGGGGGDGGGGSGTPTTITVRFVNNSPWALDPQFYTTSAALGDPEQILFLPGNQVRTGFGFAGSGLIPGGQTDQVTLNCEQAITIGTRGGQFVDQDSGTEQGTGQQRVAGIQLSYSCGDTITLTYHANGEVFTTGPNVE